MPLSPGTVIGQYRIDRRLGAGGMGEVYKAQHLMLGRDVALKTFPPAQDGSDVLALRFVREARAASALRHPNIVTVYDISDLDGSMYIAMEYVDGITLQELLRKRALSVHEALRYAVQIADALAAAHASGVLHRDVKPGNIMITRTNDVKVVDFGLARRLDAAEVSEDAPTETFGRELSLTEEGQMAGTVAYMSPEQAQGFRVDARSDIFSFGIVLYEMLSGKRPFTAPSKVATMARILNEDPQPLNVTVPELPRAVEEIVRLCLRKEPDQRAQSIYDVARMLEIAARMPSQGDALAAPESSARWRWIAAAAVFALVLLMAWSIAAASGLSASARHPKLSRVTWDAGLTRSPALSSDGRLLAYASDRGDGQNLDIFVRHTSGGEPIRLTSNPADDFDPAFSPDGATIAFRSERNGGGVYTVGSLGGPERLIAPHGNTPHFSPDGSEIAYWVGEASNTMPSGQLYIVPANGGAARRLAASFADARFPVWTPDGGHILFEGVDVWRGDTPRRDWWVVPVDGGAPVKTGAWDALHAARLSYIYPPAGWRDDRVVVAAREVTAALYDVGISGRTWRARGRPRPLTFGTGTDAEPYPAANGAIAFTSFQYEINIWARRLDANGNAVDKENRKLTTGSAYHSSISLSADGKRLAFLLGRTPHRNVWIREVQSGREEAVTVGDADKCSAAISPDGQRVAWSGCGPSAQPIYIARISPDLSTSMPEKVCDDCGRVADSSRDGLTILFVDHSTPTKVGMLTMSSGARTMIADAAHNLDHPRLSPDGSWITLAAAETGADRSRIVAIPLENGKPAPDSRWVGITDGTSWDEKPVWTARANAVLFFSRRDGFGCIWRQDVNLATRRPTGAPVEVVPFHSGRISIKEMISPLQSMCLSGDQLVFNALESTGSIWLLEDEREPSRSWFSFHL